MTITEAKKTLGMREEDSVKNWDALDELEEGIQKMMSLWSIPNYQKDEKKKELEAIRTLKATK